MRTEPAAPPGSRTRPAQPGVPRTPFVLLVIGLLGGGLICLLIVNTTLATAQYRITHLQQGNAAMSQQAQQLQQQIARDQAPGTIERRAYRLGLRPQRLLSFLDERTGRISRQPTSIPNVLPVPGFTP